ncbi:MAG: DNA-processing protein DprA, partial [Pseudomonadota bacterium]
MSETLTSSSHPPLPPTTEETQVSWLRLLRSRRVGVSTFYRLMSENNWDAEQAVRSLPGLARDAGVAGYAPHTREAAEAEYRAARLAGAVMVARGMESYPSTLAQISDAPPFLWAIGDTGLLQHPMIAVVGARNASSLGGRMARKLTEEIANAGYIVVSGLARGIDTVAHKAALGSGTIAVQAGGVDVIYPQENARLAHDIAHSGLRLSEQMMGLQPQARHFPTRNRIIAGLCLATIVVEAGARSGSLITARYAADQGRDIMAVPGHPFDPRAEGSNMLIRDGAVLVRG